MTLCITCVPKPIVNRSQIDSLQALTGIDPPEFLQQVLHTQQQQVEERRTLALEALFMLLYQRMDGGMDRNDYTLLLVAFQERKFFSKEGTDSRQAHLGGWILAEAMSLWRVTGDDWISSHPLLTPMESASSQLTMIGNLLLKQYAPQVLDRRRVYLLSKQDEMDEGNYEEPQVEAAESMAVLTFGLLLKLAHKQATASGGGEWASHASVKELATNCISVANDECGVFGYFQSSLTGLVPPPDVCQTEWDISEFDWEGENQKTDTQEPREDSGSIVTYASIGREILVGTVRAFRTTILQDVTPDKAENIGMLCHLAGHIYRNNAVLCNQLWEDWESPGSEEVEPLCQLLDVAYTLATKALQPRLTSDGQSNAPSRSGLDMALTLPLLEPLISFVASLIPRLRVGGNMTFRIVSNFFPQELVHTSLLGCMYLASSSGTFSTNLDDPTSEKRNKLLQAGQNILQSLSKLFQLAVESQDIDGINILRVALESTESISFVSQPNWTPTAAKMICDIGISAQFNSSLEEEVSTSFTSSAQQILAGMLFCKTDADIKWVEQIGLCLGQGSASRAQASVWRSFMATRKDKVKAACMKLLCNLSRSLLPFSMMEFTTEKAVLQLISTLQEGCDVAMEVIACTQHNYDFTDIKVEVVSGALSSVCNFFWSLRGIASAHASDKVVQRAKDTRDSLIQYLSTSTSLGSTLGFLSSLPVSFGLTDAIRRYSENHDIIEKKTQASAFFHRIEEKKDDSHHHLQSKQSFSSHLIQKIEEISLPDEQSREGANTLYIITIASLSLIVLWGEEAESMVLERFCEDDESVYSFLDIAKRIPAHELEDLVSNIFSLGPSRLLFSAAIPPLTSNESPTHYWPQSDTPIYHMMSRLVVPTHPSSNETAIRHCLSMKVLQLLSIGLHQSNLATQIKHPNYAPKIGGMGADSSDSILSTGCFLRSTLLLLLNEKSKNIEMDGSMLLLHLLGFLKSCVNLAPALAKAMILGESENNLEVINLITESIKSVEPLSKESVLFASSCAEVIFQLWLNCRRNSKDSVHGIRSLHQCDDIVLSLSSEGRVIQNCWVFLSRTANTNIRLKDYSGGTEGKFDQELGCVYSSLLSLRSKCLQILEKEAMHCTQIETDGSTIVKKEMLQVIQNFHEENLLCNLFNSIEFDGMIFAAQLSVEFEETVKKSALPLNHKPVGSGITLSVVTRNIPLGDTKNILVENIEAANTSMKMAQGETDLLHSLSSLGERLSTIPYTSDVQKKLHYRFSTIGCAIHALEKSAESSFLSFTTSPSSYPRLILIQMLKSACDTTNFVLSQLGNLQKEITSQQSSELVDLLGELLRSSERYLTIINATAIAGSQSLLKLQNRLRLNTLACALLAISLINESDGQKENKKYSIIRLGFCRMACDTLSLLRSVDLAETNASHRLDCYSASSEKLLLTSLSCLTILLKNGTEATRKEGTFSSHPYESDLSVTLHNSNALGLLIHHLDMNSNIIAITYSQEGPSRVGNSHAASLAVVSSIVNIAYILASSDFIGLPMLVLEGHFIQALLKNQLLLKACKEWSSPQTFRGYVNAKKLPGNSLMDRNIYNTASSDAIHNIWCCSIRIVTAMLGSKRMKAPTDDTARKMHMDTSIIAFDFLRTFESGLFSSLLSSSLQKTINQSVSSSEPIAEFGFTFQSLVEMGDALALISELCLESRRKYYDNASLHLLERFSLSVFKLTKYLSSFLGALGTARELFSSLSVLNNVIGDGNRSTDEKAPHPLLADGVSNARHEAMRNALYSSNCCKCVTSEEYQLSQQHPDNATNAEGSVSPEQSFQKSVNNDFTHRIEDFAGRCLLDCLSMIERIHPMSTSFITFSEGEAMNLHLSHVNPIGAIVALRSTTQSIVTESSLVSPRYARVTDYNHITETLDVEYFSQDCPHPETESNVPLARLAGMEDGTRRKVLFQYKSAPNYVSENALAAVANKMSLGDLILILRWCRQRPSMKENPCSISVDLVKSIGECAAILLGNETSLHNEIGINDTVPISERKQINKQLLELFGEDEDSLGSFDLQRKDIPSPKGNGLRYLLNNEFWSLLQLQMKPSLMEGKRERELVEMLSEQGGSVSTVNWGRSIKQRSRKNPFSSA